MAQITVLNVASISAVGASGKPYTKLEVTHKDAFGKVAAKTVMPFGTQKAAFDALQGAAANSVWEITVVKNQAGYNDWTGATPSTAAPAAVPSTPSNVPNAKPIPTKSTYETPEERAKRQILIVRQSSLSSAVATLGSGAKVAPTSDAVIALAEVFFTWVMTDPLENVNLSETLPPFEDVE
jgi:hypothetical protein